MKLKRLFICATFFFSSVFVYSQKAAEVASLEADRLEVATTETLAVLYEEKYKEYSQEEKSATIRAILEKNYDLTVLIRRAIGRNWRSLSPQEQSEVKELVTRLILKSFVEGLQGLGRPTIKYGEPVLITEKRIEVSSIVTFPDGRTFNLVYRLGRLKTGWQIYDILAEDVSVVANYRQQVDDHFRKGTGAELIGKLQELLEKKNHDENNEL